MPQMHLTPAGGLVAASQGPELRIDMSFWKGPVRFTGAGGYVGSVTVQHKVNGAWVPFDVIASGSDLLVHEPLKIVRVDGTHTGANAVVVMTSAI